VKTRPYIRLGWVVSWIASGQGKPSPYGWSILQRETEVAEIFMLK
jgi:hypothetical protein